MKDFKKTISDFFVIIDQSAIDAINEPGENKNEILGGLAIDLRRMQLITWQDLYSQLFMYTPYGQIDKINAYKVVVKPSDVSFRPGLYRLYFHVQYGRVDKRIMMKHRAGSFKPISNEMRYSTESLPFLN